LWDNGDAGPAFVVRRVHGGRSALRLVLNDCAYERAGRIDFGRRQLEVSGEQTPPRVLSETAVWQVTIDKSDGS
jgi:hypothetical protein